jgi:hypothetical protein
MKSLPKFAFLGLLLLATTAAEAASITWTDTINFSPNVYISQWNPGADAVANFPLKLDPLSATGVDSLALVALEGGGELQSSGIVSVLDNADLDKRHPPKPKHKPKPKPTTVPEPGVLSLIGLGLLALALVTRRTHRLHAAAIDAEGVSATTSRPYRAAAN